MRSVFVLAVVGDDYVRAANIALSYLKRFSRSDIVILTGRTTHRPDHDQVIDVALPSGLDNHQASIFLKTSLLGALGGLEGTFCYLDSDIIAVREGIDSIFDYQTGPVTFASDQVAVDMFSRYAVNCRCRERTCNHLREAILCTFGIEVRRCDWTPWNGGVFLFDKDSVQFFTLWHDYTRQIMSDPYWRTRDQGTLAAAVWTLSLQDQTTLPLPFNFIVDRMWGISPHKRSGLTPADFHVREDYSLTGADGRIRPYFLHFVNGGVNRPGWRNWDEVVKLIGPPAAQDLSFRQD